MKNKRKNKIKVKIKYKSRALKDIVYKRSRD